MQCCINTNTHTHTQTRTRMHTDTHTHAHNAQLNSNKMADKAMGHFPLLPKPKQNAKNMLAKAKEIQNRGTKNCILIMFNWHSSIWVKERKERERGWEGEREGECEWERMCKNCNFHFERSPLAVSLSLTLCFSLFQVGRVCCCSSFRIQGAQSVLCVCVFVCVPGPDFNKHTHTHTVTVSHTRTHTHICIFQRCLRLTACCLFTVFA